MRETDEQLLAQLPSEAELEGMTIAQAVKLAEASWDDVPPRRRMFFNWGLNAIAREVDPITYPRFQSGEEVMAYHQANPRESRLASVLDQPFTYRPADYVKEWRTIQREAADHRVIEEQQ